MKAALIFSGADLGKEVRPELSRTVVVIDLEVPTTTQAVARGFLLLDELFGLFEVVISST